MSDSSSVDSGEISSLKEVAAEIVQKIACDRQTTLEFLQQCSYHHAWLVHSPSSEHKTFILRIANPGIPSLNPYSTRHQVGCLSYLQKSVPSIPVPRVLVWDDGSSGAGHAYVAEEFIEGENLTEIRLDLTEEQKESILLEIANVSLILGETRFDYIGGFTADAGPGPTIEAAKVFNGRHKTHSPEAYNIGPYTTTKEYVASCYDREIYHWTHAEHCGIIDFADHFEDISVPEYVAQLQNEKQAEVNDDSSLQVIDNEPRVLIHDDFRAANFLIRDGHLVGVIGWEFSGVYPLSCFLQPYYVLADLFEVGNYAIVPEVERWQDFYKKNQERLLQERGWREEDIATAMIFWREIIGVARQIMFPKVLSHTPDASGAEDSGDDES